MGVGGFRLALVAGFVAVLLAVSAAGADFAWDPEAAFDPPEPADFFGRAVALDDPTLVTGAPGDDTLAVDAGAVWVHTRSEEGTWSFVVKLNASGGSASDQFGSAVAVEGDTLVAGAPFADDGRGAVYVFNRSTGGLWTQSARLVPSGSPGAINFGSAVDLAGNTIVIGAPAAGTGSAYVFNADAGNVWTETTRLVTADAAAADLAGTSVALSGDTILMGASQQDPAGDASGAVYAFVRGTGGAWSQQAKLIASDAAPGDLFGDEVDLIADLAVIGARANDDAGTGSGSAYVFTRNLADIWSEQTKLVASDASAAALFGAAVSVDGTQLVVGAPGAGSAYVFESPSWEETNELNGTLLYGGAVAVDGETLAIATQGVPSGVVDVYRRSEALLPPPVPVAVFDSITGEWSVADEAGTVSTFFYGVPGDIPLAGDWDCDGDDTVGMFR
ncbi:MAG: FG-GAP repeat protein, partial [Acidimicrobiia bacterium]|nr:FG-GAP repeat protein [Acidimicrobiia bacterium]